MLKKLIGAVLLVFLLSGCGVYMEIPRKPDTAEIITPPNIPETTITTVSTPAQTTEAPMETFDIHQDFAYTTYLEEAIKEYGSLLPFLTEQQVLLFYQAQYIQTNFEIVSGFYFIHDGDYEQNLEFGRSGVSYDSTFDFISRVFTKEKTTAFTQSPLYFNNNGELCYYQSKGESNTSFLRIEFTLVDKTESEIKFIGTGYYVPQEETVRSEVYHFHMVKTTEGWRFSQFELWL